MNIQNLKGKKHHVPTITDKTRKCYRADTEKKTCLDIQFTAEFPFFVIKVINGYNR